jgi:hypothetical protein
MSWDILIQQFPDGARRVADIPDTFTAPPIGKRPDVVAKLRAALPNANFSDRHWVKLHGDDYSLECAIADDDVLYGITLHVRGSDDALPHISAVLHALGLRAIDSWTGEFFDPEVAPHSLARWRSYIEDEG